jgi:hypothetical protein
MAQIARGFGPIVKIDLAWTNTQVEENERRKRP